MAAKIRGLGRLLVALTLMGWGRFAFVRRYFALFPLALSAMFFSHLSYAASYIWTYTGGSGITGSSASSACSNAASAYGYPSSRLGSSRYDASGAHIFQCFFRSESGGEIQRNDVIRSGDSCADPNAVYNPQTGSCDTPKDCSATSGKQITKAQTCTYNASLKTYLCEDQIEFEGCLYTGGGGRKCVANLSTGQGVCTGDFYGSGQPAGEGPDSCTEESCTPPRDPNVPPADEQCVTNGDLTICHKPQDEGCGTVNGKEGCFQEKPGCGYFNGTYQCVDTDKPKNNCGYFNGKLTCMDPKDPTKTIDPNSPDHPNNGGNADGNENNDPKAPGDTSKSPQGSDEGATNEAIGKLGEELGDKIGEGNDLLGDIKGILEGIADGIEGLTDGLLGDDYDGSGDGDGDGVEGAGSDLGNELAGMIGDQLGEAQDEQLASDELSLDKIVDNVDGDKWFGDNSQVAGLLDLAKDLLPAHTACADVAISFNLDRYSTRLILPVCDLTRLKPLLEWIIYVVTAIGLWKIAYSTLRMEDAKASKGGF
ncbi:hypothetical protein [Pseudomonas yangonensis]|uniref:hypothetical protein n=1 Tax=Pseudomonas yangonensis TaxID=2579922 RepID=UPI001379EEBB|nr:hypothetical protein [Pseudomonas yangonensis]